MNAQTQTQTRGAKVNAEITALLRARYTLLWIVTREEGRVERAVIEAAGRANYKTLLWDCVDGIVDMKGQSVSKNGDPIAAMDYLNGRKDKSVLVLRDFHKWIDPMTLRKLRNLSRSLQSASASETRSIVVLTPSAEIPPELADHATVIDYPLPDRFEVARILDDVVGSLAPEVQAVARERLAKDGARDAAIDAAVGLSAEEIANCFARSLVDTRSLDPKVVAAEKKRVIAREKVLTWYDPDPRGLDGVGGLDCLKDWLTTRRSAFSERARAFGLPAPRGVMLVGVPGCGKSLVSKCVATAWGVPLLRLDLGALKSKYVGESEGNIRKALAVAEAVAPCVLWLDEIEKALGGATGPQGDGGVAADALGTVLSWMQERQGSVFVVATSNDVRALPPELLRKGRFDEVFWVDLPTRAERSSVLAAALVKHGRAPGDFDLEEVARATDGFASAEVANIVPDALFAAFNDGERALTTADLLAAAGTVVPLARTAGERIEALRSWAQGRARKASLPEIEEQSGGGRALDFDT
jgi:hypothetical protein